MGVTGSPEIKRLFTDRMRTQAMTKPRGMGPSPLFYSPLSPSLMAPSRLCLSFVVPPLRNLTRHWLASHPPGARQSEVDCTPAEKINFVSLVAYGPKTFLLSLCHGGLQLLKPGRAVPDTKQPVHPNENFIVGIILNQVSQYLESMVCLSTV